VQSFRITDLSGDFVNEDIALQDTTQAFTELRALGQLGLTFESLAHRLVLRPQLSVGTDLSRATAGIEYRWARPGGSRRFGLSMEAEGRHFAKRSDFSLSSDTFRARARAHWRQRWGSSAEIGVRGRGELTRYERRSVYEYDENRGDVALTLSVHRSWQLSWDADVGVGGRAAPDTTEISFGRAYASSTLDWALGDRWRTDVYAAVEHRVFRDRTVRSPVWDLVLEPRLTRDLGLRWRLTANVAMEWLSYEQSTAVYFDAWTGRAGLLTQRRVGAVELGIEPRWSWLASPQPVEDRFEQPSVVLRLDWFGSGRVWLSLTEEVGVRDYVEVETDGIDLYSDYTFLRTTLLGSIALASDLSFDVFLSDEPESHRRDDDDGRLTLITLSLRRTF
jgi:hypothetical protein